MIGPDLKTKVLEKIYSICYVRKLRHEKIQISIPEFKFVIGVYRIRKEEWFPLAKEFQSQKMITLHGGNPIEVHLEKIIRE